VELPTCANSTAKHLQALKRFSNFWKFLKQKLFQILPQLLGSIFKTHLLGEIFSPSIVGEGKV